MRGSDDEAAFLSCVMQSPDIVFKAGLGETHFTDAQHRRIWTAMQACADRKVAIDYISIGDIDAQIDKAYLAEIYDRVPSGANWGFYQGRIITTFQRERLRKLGMMLTDLSGSDAPAELVERAERELLEIGTNGQTRKIVRMAEVMGEALRKVQDREESGGALPGLATGLPGLDALIGGLQPSRYIIIGARPSDGKSALALNMACAISMKYSEPCGIVSAESSNYELAMRALSSEGHIRGNALMLGMLSRADHSSILTTSAKIKESPLYLYDAPNIAFSELKSVCRQMVAIHGVKVIFIDYIQIVQWDDKRLPFYEQVKNVSLGIKQLARELKIPIVALAQLRRDAEGREPEMADLGDSSQLEKDADALMFIHHKKTEEGRDPISFLLVKKNRDGARGNVNVVFLREYVKFMELASGREG